MDIKKKYLHCVALFFFIGAYAAAQETNSQDTAGSPQNASVENAQTQQKQDAKKKTQPKAEAPKQKTENRLQSLLPVTEGNFKYSRIPEITLPQPAQMGDISNASEEPQKESVRIAEDEKKPFLFGIGSDLTKVLILLFILAIFVFYRVNSKKSRRRKYFKY